MSDLRYAGVKFHTGPKNYAYMTHIQDLVPGDEVVVGTKNGITMATFAEYQEPNSMANNYIFAKCNKESTEGMRASRAAAGK